MSELPVPVGDEAEEESKAKWSARKRAQEAESRADEALARVAGLEAREASLRDALEQDREKWSFDTLVFIARQLLETNYPAHIFVGTSGDPGPAFVVRIREALAALADSGEAGS